MPGAATTQTPKKSELLERAHAAVAARKDPRSFSDAFSKAVLNHAGINISSKPFSQERLDRDLKMADRVDGRAGDVDEQPQAIVDKDVAAKPLPWGDADAKELGDLLRRLGHRDMNLSSEAFLKPFFRHLRLQDYQIRDLDTDVHKFTKLTFLDVSNNPLRAIGALPPCLQRLKAYNTNICKVTCKRMPSLVFLGLGYSPLATEGLNDLAQAFPGLLSLDLSFTEILSLADVALAVEGDLQQLRQLCLAGSPASLLPHYRLKLIKLLPQLQYLDGVQIVEAEMKDAKLVSLELQPEVQSDEAEADEDAPKRPPQIDVEPSPEYDRGAAIERPPAVRFAVQFLRLEGARVLLATPAQPIFAKMKAIADAALQTAQAAGEDMDPWEPEDQIFESCKKGFIRLRFQLPDGSWAETEEVRLTAEMAQAAVETDGGKAYDLFDLQKVKAPDATPFYMDLDIQEDNLLRFSRWMRRGMPVKVFFREAPPPSPEELVEMRAAAEAEAAAKAKAKAKAAPRQVASPVPPLTADDDDSAPPPVPEEVAIGGAVVPLDGLLNASARALIVTEAHREAGVLPPLPDPMVSAPDVRVVPIARFLEPNVQVPFAEKELKKEWVQRAGIPSVPLGRPEAANLRLQVILYAGEPPVEEEEPPPVEDPKAKAKGKK